MSMRRLLIFVALGAGAALLAACIRRREPGPLLVVSATRDGDGCRVLVQGERVTSERLREIGRRSPAPRAIVIYSDDTPYKCIGSSNLTLQRAGLASVEAVQREG